MAMLVLCKVKTEIAAKDMKVKGRLLLCLLVWGSHYAQTLDNKVFTNAIGARGEIL